ncbi:MAG: helix-turn-helix transcriptional regulator [Pyrinomonadaceae bacterium]
MVRTKLDRRFFESTRGKVVLALRGSARTVNELAEALNLTDNAIRAHLLTLERDGLIEPGGTVKGYRKPHYIYRLTNEARHLFPKFYDSLFNRLLDSVKRRMSATAVAAVLEEVGHSLAVSFAVRENDSRNERIEKAVAALQELGGAASAVVEDKTVVVKSSGCPFADAVMEHPDACKIAEALVEEMVGAPVREACDRNGAPKCRFVIEPTA